MREWRGSTARLVAVAVSMLTIACARGNPEQRARAGTLAPITTALTNSQAPTAAYVTDAAQTAIVNRMLAGQRGLSGRLRATIQPVPAPMRVDSLPPGATVRYQRGGEVANAPSGAGIWNVLLSVGNAARPVSY